MSDNEGGLVISCFSLGFMIGLTVSMLWSTPTHEWRKEAIEHGAAQYSPVTGKFEWKEKDVRPD